MSVAGQFTDPVHRETAAIDRIFSPAGISAVARNPRSSAHIVRRRSDGAYGVATSEEAWSAVGYAVCDEVGEIPGIYPEWLGGQEFRIAHGLRFPYVVGEMANGIATTDMVIAAARAGMLGIFGAAGLAPREVEAAVVRMRRELGDGPGWGVNLIHSPTEPGAEEATADLLIAHRVPTVSLSAFMELTPAVAHLALAGIRRGSDGSVIRARRVIAKVSRPETAAEFMNPAPPALLRTLTERRLLTREEAELAVGVPLAPDVTAEADSGGHTDNRPLTALLPRLLALRDESAVRNASPVRIGVGGGLGTPQAVSAAFSAGAAYVVTGSVNQTTTEAGVSDTARKMLSGADLADTVMAPAADMFELGVKVQVLSRGTLFPQRAQFLHDLYRRHASLEEIPGATRSRLERDVLRAPLSEVWAETERFWQTRDPRELERAARDDKHRMALVFRWYLGQSSRWAVTGDQDRRTDYQLWCGPALGAFNHWVAGSFLADHTRRSVTQVGLNLLEGATVVTRAQQLRTCGVPVPPSAFAFTPRPLT